MSIDMNRKQFLGTVFATAACSCIPSFGRSEKSEFDKCKDDILYFVDNYLEVNDTLNGKLKMTPQQREYLKHISIAPDYFFCAKGRQVGISTANNVFAYWKTIFSGSNSYVFIVEPNSRMKDRVNEMYWGVSNSGGFMPLSGYVHFISPSTMMAHDLTNENNTYILDEFDFWDEYSLNRLSKQHLDRFLLNSLYAKELSPEQFERFKAHMIVVSSYCSPYGFFSTLMSSADNSRKLVLPSPTRGLKS